MATRTYEFVVSSSEHGLRLDRILTRRVAGLGRKRAAELFRAGAVRLEGRVAGKAELPSAGLRVSVAVPEPDVVAPEAAPLSVLHEGPDVVVIDKPAGQPSAILRGSDRDTAVNALLARYPEMAEVGFGPREPGIIHRLDTQTSGVLVAARNPAAFSALRRTLENGTLTKQYLALVESASIDDAGVITEWLGPHPKNQRKVAVYPRAHPGARAAHSEYRVLERAGRFALVEITASRAYRHQVRAHLAARGSPILADALYGGARVPLGGRHALHASFVSYPGPELAPFAVVAPLPGPLVELLAHARR